MGGLGDGREDAPWGSASSPTPNPTPIFTLGALRSPPHPGTRAEPHPGTRASRPHPYSWLEVAERRRKVAGRQPPCRRVRHGPVRMKGKAPLPFHPGGGDGQGCAGLMCGRDARVPGWASSTQQTGNMICTTPRIGAKRRLQASRITPGNAGVSPASLFLAGGGGASAQGCRQAATLPA